jgi:hypothetical protein
MWSWSLRTKKDCDGEGQQQFVQPDPQNSQQSVSDLKGLRAVGFTDFPHSSGEITGMSRRTMTVQYSAIDNNVHISAVSAPYDRLTAQQCATINTSSGDKLFTQYLGTVNNDRVVSTMATAQPKNCPRNASNGVITEILSGAS